MEKETVPIHTLEKGDFFIKDTLLDDVCYRVIKPFYHSPYNQKVSIGSGYGLIRVAVYGLCTKNLLYDGRTPMERIHIASQNEQVIYLGNPGEAAQRAKEKGYE